MCEKTAKKNYKKKQMQLGKQQKKINVAGRASQLDAGSLTVEAALIFPFFIMALYAVLCISQLLITEQEIHNGLLETARYAAKYKYVENKTKAKQENKEDGITENMQLPNESSKTALNTLVLQTRFAKNVDKRRLAMVSGGVCGVSLEQSDLDEDDNILVLRAKAQCKIPVLFFGTYSVTLQEAVKQKAFLGYNGKNAFENGEYVYVAENGSVYHTNLHCSHIAIRIIPVSQISEVRAKRYCHKCMKEGRLTGDYVTVCGDCIHSNINCSALKRTIRMVKKEQVKGLPLCSRCAKGGE